ncbi:MAG: hypothetical protein JWQ11_3028, partial [Rhizobacter sp.]|nr:hypothetical protein [Rhizobacter sp.]
QLLNGDDAGIHLRWQRAYATEVWSGVLMPRWLETLNDGYGSPAFFIYPPFGQWVASAFYPFFPSTQDSALRLSLSLVLASALGGIGVYSWTRIAVSSRRAALFGSLLYILLPYHLYIDTYHRVAFGELWGLAAAPWLFFGVLAIFERLPFAKVILACATAAVLLCHAPSALMLLPAVVAYVALLAWCRRDAKGVLSVLATGSIGLAIAGSYVSTALTHTEFIDISALFDDPGPRWWLFSLENSAAKPTIYFLVGGTLAFQLLLSFGLLSVTWQTARTAEIRRMLAFCMTIVCVTTVLQTSYGSTFWFPGNPFSKIQLPWRLQTLQVLTVSVLGAFAYRHMAELKRTKLLFFTLSVLAVTAATSAGLIGLRAAHYRSIGKSVPTESLLYKDQEDAREYRLADIGALPASLGKARAIVYSGQGNVVAEDWRSRSIRLSTESVGGISILVHQFNYTGWQYRLDSTIWRATQSEGPLISISVPGGHHGIELRMPPTTAEQVGKALSIVGFVGLLALFMVEFVSRPASFPFRATSLSPARS